MRAGPRTQLARWVGVCLLALVPAAVRADTPKTAPTTTGTTGTTGSMTMVGTPATGNAGHFGPFALPELTADEQTQLMTDAMMAAELIFGFLGATPTEEELTAATEAFYRLLEFLTLLQKFGAMFAPASP